MLYIHQQPVIEQRERNNQSNIELLKRIIILLKDITMPNPFLVGVVESVR